MSRTRYLKPFLLMGAFAASLGAGAAFGQAKPESPIPVKAASGPVPADSIVENTTLTADRTWILKGFTLVKRGVTLTIEPGTEIKGDPNTKGVLIVDVGAYLVAAGTREKPIIFRGSSEERGTWGGIVILGKARNNQGDYIQYEALPWALHGGRNDANSNDSSGVLTYVQLHGPGFPIATDRELNGLTLCSVGRRTVIHHIQVHRGDDDGIEWFGGTVNTSHLVVTNTVDDSYDTDHGYSGNSQYMIAIQSSEPARPRPGVPAPEQVGDRGLECGSSTGGSTPYTNPSWKNITFIDNGVSGGAFEAKEECGGTYEKMVLVAGGAEADRAAPWAMAFTSDPTVVGIADVNPYIDFKQAYITGKWTKPYDIVSGVAGAAALAEEVLKTKITTLPHSQINSYGLYKDLRPSHPSIIADGAGAIVGNDLWYQGWTAPNTVKFDLGEEPPPNAGAPAVTLTRAAGNLFAPASFTLSATATDPDGIASLQILLGTEVIGASTTGTLSVDVANRPAGTYSYTVRATDKHFNPMTGSGSLDVVISAPNAGAPTVSLTRTGEDLVAPASFTLNALAADPDGIASLQILLGDSVVGSGTAGTLSVNLTGRREGVYSYTVKATDGHGLPQTSTGSLVVTIAAPPANQAPEVSLTRSSGTLIAPAAFTLIGAAADAHGIASLQLLEGDAVLASSETGTLTFDVGDKGAGTYTYTLKATDKHPLDPMSRTMDLVVTVFPEPADSSNASGPVVVIARSGPDYLIAPGNFELRVQADDADGISEVEVLLDGERIGHGASGTLNVPRLNMAAAKYTFTVRATDNHANNKQTTTKEFTVEVNAPNGAPAVELTRTGDELTDGDDITLKATAEDDDGIAALEILLNGAVVGSSATGSLEIPVADIKAGTYVYVVRATDKHGNDAKTATKELKIEVKSKPVSIAMRDLDDITSFSARGPALVVDAKGYGTVGLTVWTLSGKRVGTRTVHLALGRNTIDMGLLQGVHIVRVTDGLKARSARVVFNLRN